MPTGTATIHDETASGQKTNTFTQIYLGSGNILLEPNDQYLCIVPDRGAAAAKASGVFLPFEGDTTQSVILSKAFLLAEDARIKDETIARQIRS